MKIYWHEREKGKAWRLVVTPKAIICNMELVAFEKYLITCLGGSTVIMGKLDEVKDKARLWVIEEVKKLLSLLSA